MEAAALGVGHSSGEQLFLDFPLFGSDVIQRRIVVAGLSRTREHCPKKLRFVLGSQSRPQSCRSLPAVAEH